MNKFTIATAALVLTASFYAQAEPADSFVVSIPNPASAYCIKIGGKLRLEKTPQGESNICILPDGTEIEEWELYRRDHPQQLQK